ncbi:MAG: hypothetical protein FWF35_01685 [Elusimicrobia bacterium]|nr:hypothetical protein [Elusimicrobiota bacterium]
MKKKKINLTLATVLLLSAGAVLMFAVHAYAACGDNYHACRCKQYTGGNFSSLGVSSLNDCCTYRQQGCDVGTSYFSGTGLTFDTSSGKCKTTCASTCPTGQTRTSVSYSDDGACCMAAPSITCSLTSETWNMCTPSSSVCLTDAWGDNINPATAAQISALPATATAYKDYFDVKYAKDADTGSIWGGYSGSCVGTACNISGVSDCPAGYASTSAFISAGCPGAAFFPSSSSSYNSITAQANANGTSAWSNGYGVRACRFNSGGNQYMVACFINPGYFYRDYWCQ